MAKSAYEQLVHLFLAPFNLKPFALVGSLPHALGLGSYPIYGLRVIAPDRAGDVVVNKPFVDANLGELMTSADLSRYVL